MNSVCAYQTCGMVSRGGAFPPQMLGGSWCFPAPLPARFYTLRRRSPAAASLRLFGRKVVKSAKVYTRKTKHRKDKTNGTTI